MTPLDPNTLPQSLYRRRQNPFGSTLASIRRIFWRQPAISILAAEQPALFTTLLSN